MGQRLRGVLLSVLPHLRHLKVRLCIDHLDHPALDPSPATDRKDKFTNEPKDAERLRAHTSMRRDHPISGPIVDTSGVLRTDFVQETSRSEHRPFGKGLLESGRLIASKTSAQARESRVKGVNSLKSVGS